MERLKQLPICYKGELHNVKLINFSVDPAEVVPLLPRNLSPLLYKGRGLISMVNVALRNMHPTATGDMFAFGYRHVAFRLLVDDSKWNGGTPKGLFFLRSFTDNPLIAKGGRLFTNFNFEQAKMNDLDYLFSLKTKNFRCEYALEDRHPDETSEELMEKVGRLDRAYAAINDRLHVTRIVRKCWPIEWMNCYHFETNFFKTARLEGAFRIREKIDYQWLAPHRVEPIGF